MYKFDQRFPFFNMYDEKKLYQVLKKNKELKFYYSTGKDYEIIGTNLNEIRMSCHQYYFNLTTNKDFRNYTFIGGIKKYCLVVNRLEIEDIKKLMNKLYKRHRTRFLNQYTT